MILPVIQRPRAAQKRLKTLIKSHPCVGHCPLPGRFVKVINEVVQGLSQVTAYLDDVIAFGSDPTAHAKTRRALFERLHKHDLKLSPRRLASVPRTQYFWATPFRPQVYAQILEKVPALMKTPMPKNLKLVRALIGGVGYHRKFLPDLSKRIRPLTPLLRKGIHHDSTPAMEVIVRQILAELAAPPTLVFPDWDAVADGSRPFHAYCDACIDGFGAAFKQEQPYGSVRPIACISRAILDSERYWTPLDLEAGNIIWAIKRLRGYLWGTKFRVFSDHKAAK